ILHLSDMHFGDMNDAAQYIVQLRLDLKQNLQIDTLHYLVITGDIGTYSIKGEYDAACFFVNCLTDEFNLLKHRIIVVPGNHDLNWDIAKNAYDFIWGPPKGLKILKSDIRIRSCSFGFLQRNEENYKKRFDNFNKYFFEKITGEVYPKDPEEQTILHQFPEHGILFLCINSSLEVDHHKPHRNRIILREGSIFNSFHQHQINSFFLKIGVMHHDPTKKIKDEGLIDTLCGHGFRVLMHGHRHETTRGSYRCGDKVLEFIGVGAFGKPTNLKRYQPLQYQILQYDNFKKKIKIFKRIKTKIYGVWGDDTSKGGKSVEEIILCAPDDYKRLRWGEIQNFKDAKKIAKQEVRLLYDRVSEISQLKWPKKLITEIEIESINKKLIAIAFQMQEDVADRNETGKITEKSAWEYFSSDFNDSLGNAKIFLDYLVNQEGILTWTEGYYSFSSLEVQQFLAANHLANMIDYPSKSLQLIKGDSDKWQQIYTLSAIHASMKKGLEYIITSINTLCSMFEKLTDLDDKQLNYIIAAGKTLFEIGIDKLERSENGKTIIGKVKTELKRCLDIKGFDLLKYLEIEDTLYMINDSRFDPTNWYLPSETNWGYVEVPLHGSLKNIDTGLQQVDYVSNFAISKYPVTKAQFKAFIDESGHKTESDKWQDYGQGSHPVVFVSWCDAVEYSKWLTKKMHAFGWTFRLPSEVEWKKAAGVDFNRLYPWGDSIDKSKLNFKDTGFEGTCPVGYFTGGASPYGCLDMAGNAFEWMIDTDYRKNTFDEENTRYQIICGGAWDTEQDECKLNYSTEAEPKTTENNIGFRLVREKIKII
ncbi:MAG: hypothetical protein A2097_14625, partial [Desulfobacula sp. GWF2_41_7]